MFNIMGWFKKMLTDKSRKESKNENESTLIDSESAVIDSEIIHVPNNLQIENDKCLKCHQYIIKKEQIDEKLNECSYCRRGWTNSYCSCSYTKYKYVYIECKNCKQQYICQVCKKYDFGICNECSLCNGCTNNKIYGYARDIKYILKVKYNDKDEAKVLGAKWDKNNKIWYVPINTDCNKFLKWEPIKYDTAECNNCFKICSTCNEKVYHKHINEDMKNMCNNCIATCHMCKMESNTIYLFNDYHYCKICVELVKFNPSTINEIYVENSQEERRANITFFHFIDWTLDKKKLICIDCSKEYWFVTDNSKKPKWQSDVNEYLQKCCEQCYNKRRNELIKKFTNENPNPSNEKYIYELDKDGLKWIKIKFVNYCLNCKDQINVSVQKEYEQQNYKYCIKCNPSDNSHKYVFSQTEYNWILNKVRMFDGRHKWIKPTKEYDENYYCSCDKCKNKL